MTISESCSRLPSGGIQCHTGAMLDIQILGYAERLIADMQSAPEENQGILRPE